MTKTPPTRNPWWKGERGEWYLLVQVVLVTLVLTGPRSLPGIPRPTGVPWVYTATGTLMLLVGILIALGGTIALGRNLTPLPMPKDNAKLVVSGVYRFVRHPIYSGIIFMAYGFALLCQSWLTLGYTTLLLIFFEIKSRREEKWLVAKFPAYAGYQQRVKRFIPFLH